MCFILVSVWTDKRCPLKICSVKVSKPSDDLSKSDWCTAFGFSWSIVVFWPWSGASLSFAQLWHLGLTSNFPVEINWWLNCKCPNQIHSCSKIAFFRSKIFWLGSMGWFKNMQHAVTCFCSCLPNHILPNPGRIIGFPHPKKLINLIKELPRSSSEGYVHGYKNTLLGLLSCWLPMHHPELSELVEILRWYCQEEIRVSTIKFINDIQTYKASHCSEIPLNREQWCPLHHWATPLGNKSL